MRDALRRNLGEMLLRLPLFKNEKDEEETKAFLKVVSKLDRLTSTALKFHELGEKFGPFLVSLIS
ncbi:MAG: hypothetical protein IID17_09380 [Nitrospinae bacterium]|nr:hypothetical protein [Nitrospinota bacterium]